MAERRRDKAAAAVLDTIVLKRRLVRSKVDKDLDGAARGSVNNNKKIEL